MTNTTDSIVAADSVPPVPKTSEPPTTLLETSTIDFKVLGRWTRWILASNPFYILSAVLVLWSMDRLSLDSRIFSSEMPQLFFNVSAFQVYELLLVGTAIFLAGRGIWYDSGLLIGLENLFIAVPFLLVSQVLLTDSPAALGLCLIGCILAVLRVGALKRYVKDIRLPARLLFSGAVLLLLNLGLPVLMRYLHKDANNALWDDRAATLKTIEWFALAPLCAGLAFLLPKPQCELDDSQTLFFKPFFPLVTLLLWVAGTMTHFYCIGYVYRFTWDITCIIPAVWVATWVLWYRALDFNFIPLPHFRRFTRTLSLLPMVAAGWAVLEGNMTIGVILAALTSFIYGVFSIKAKWFRAALVGSLFLTLFALPPNILTPLGLTLSRGELVIAMGGIGAFVGTLTSKNPRFGIIGAILLPILAASGFSHRVLDGFALVQMGLFYLMLHSLRWDDKSESGVFALRVFSGVLWLGASGLWMLMDPVGAGRVIVYSAVLILATYLAVYKITGKWASWTLPVSAILVLGLHPLFWGIKAAHTVFHLAGQIPTGLLILGAGFGMFGLGTIVALTRSFWTEKK